tara:strand:- start:14076 stop:14864 length:789 start_codon:yes stop_codon:yes gene_type:complete
MKIGIIGLGIVGSACKTGFEYCKYNVYVHDLKLNSKIEDVLQTEIVYICVPTPSNNNLCDTSIVESVIHNLYNLNYQGIIAIKSTIPPGTTQALIEKYDDRILFVPEFLKERSAEYDFKFDHKLLLVGTENVNHYYVVIRSHSDLPKDIQRISPTEAELTKYYHNSFNATRIVFANIFFELCSKLNADYDKVKESFLKYSNMPDEYLDVKPELRGYGGACLPKDVSALQGFCEQLNLPYDFFENLNIENKKFKTTVFKGMRK